MKTTRFPSRVDALFLELAAVAVLMLLAQGYLLRATAPAAGPILLVIAILLLPVFALLALPWQYELQSEQLLIQAGRLKWRILYKDISAIEPNSNPHSAPALSLQRVKITHTSGTMLVSPRERDLFIRLLSERVQQARRQGV
jgi:hypothetical protein